MKIVKSIIIIFILLLPVIILGNPSYVELNDLAIIRGIGVSCGDEVNLYLQEIIPVKGDSGIDYQYDYYQGDGDQLDAAFSKISNKTRKKLYLSKTGYLVTNCRESDFILEKFQLHDIKIYHVSDDVLKKLKKTKM